MKKIRMKLFFIFLAFFSPFVFSQVYTTYHWHLQQPIYWPEVSTWDSRTYQKAWESITLGGAHPENNLTEIFGKADRVAAYQYRIRDAIAAIAQPHGGAQISYSGCLVENVESLAAAGALARRPGHEAGLAAALRAAVSYTHLTLPTKRIV